MTTGPIIPPGPGPVTMLRDPAATQRAAEAELKVDHLERELNHLILICEGLWNLLKEKDGYTDQDLIDRVTSVEKNACKPDGTKRIVAPRQCPKCHRMPMRYQPTCPYCGGALPATLFE
jgi:hypothetical protein